jgi:hypothetical protein
MSEPGAPREVVALFDDAAAAITHEMRFAEFEAYAARDRVFDEAYSGRKVLAAYGGADGELNLIRAVLFVLPVDAEGRVDAAFNVKIRYLSEQAGPGPDLGRGPIALACQSQCPVPWDVGKLWEAEGQGDAHPLAILQRQIRRNQLGFQIVATPPPNPVVPPPPAKPVAPPPLQKPAAPPVAATGALHEAFGAPIESTPRPVPKLVGAERSVTKKVSAKRRTRAVTNVSRAAQLLVTATPASAPERDELLLETTSFARAHGDRLESAKLRFRDELDAQQQMYLEQINGYRDEIRRLKSTLRKERDRSRKLQALIRGET